MEKRHFFGIYRFLKAIYLLHLAFFIILASSVPQVVSSAMTGGGYEIYGDTFSTVEDTVGSGGGTYTLYSSGGEFGAGIIETAATGSITGVERSNFIFNETLTLHDGTSSHQFIFLNVGGSFSGRCKVDGGGYYYQPCDPGDMTVIDTGGGASESTMVDRFVYAINTSTVGITATANDLTVDLVNDTGGTVGNQDITETVVNSDFVVTGMSGGGVGYSLRGGFQAMEKGSLSLEFTTTSVSLGTLSLTSVASTTVTSTISTDSSTGYSLSLDESGNLVSGLNDINDVADGSVTAGSEEYGIATFGGGGVLGADTAIVDGLEVAASVGIVSDQETGLIFKAAIGGTSRAGAYTQTLTATLVVNP